MSMFCLKLAIFSKSLLNVTQYIITRPPRNSALLSLILRNVVSFCQPFWWQRLATELSTNQPQSQASWLIAMNAKTTDVCKNCLHLRSRDKVK